MTGRRPQLITTTTTLVSAPQLQAVELDDAVEDGGAVLTGAHKVEHDDVLQVPPPLVEVLRLPGEQLLREQGVRLGGEVPLQRAKGMAGDVAGVGRQHRLRHKERRPGGPAEMRETWMSAGHHGEEKVAQAVRVALVAPDAGQVVPVVEEVVAEAEQPVGGAVVDQSLRLQGPQRGEGELLVGVGQLGGGELGGEGADEQVDQPSVVSGPGAKEGDRVKLKEENRGEKQNFRLLFKVVHVLKVEDDHLLGMPVEKGGHLGEYRLHARSVEGVHDVELAIGRAEGDAQVEVADAAGQLLADVVPLRQRVGEEDLRGDEPEGLQQPEGVVRLGEVLREAVVGVQVVAARVVGA